MSEPITRIIFRRGLDIERKQITLNQGEPGFAVDTNRLFVGDGQTAGGISVGSRFLGFTTFGTTNSFVDPFKGPLSGDMVFDFGSTLLYVLTGSDYAKTNNYAPLGTSYTVLGSDTIESQGGILEVKGSSLDFSYFNSTAVGLGLEISPQTTINLATPSPELQVVNNRLAITDNGVTNAKLNVMGPDTLKGKLTVAGTPEDIPLLAIAQILAPLVNAQPSVATVPVGTILDFGGVTAPNGYLVCDGQAVSRTTYAPLFATIGTRWGVGNNTTTFNVPDLRRRTTVGSGGTSLSNVATTVGSIGGAENVLLTSNESGLRQHSHTGTGNINLNHTHIFGRWSGGDDGQFVFKYGVTSFPPNSFNGADRRGGITGDGGGGGVAYNWDSITSLDKAFVTSEPQYIQDAGTAVSFTTAIVNAQPAIDAHNNMQPSAVVTKIIKY